jgi:hypothetical protein
MGKANLSRKERGQMYFNEVEVVELGLAEELIQDDIGFPNTEGTSDSRVKPFSAIYVADAE